MRRLATVPALLLLGLLVGGCAADSVFGTLGPPPGRPPWRTVLLPVIPGSPGEGKETPVFDTRLLEEARSMLALEIPRGPYHVISLPRVDHALPPAAGPIQGQGEIARAGRALGADLVIQPELFSWKRRYYIVHSVARVGMRVKVYDGRTGALLAVSSHERVRNQGLLKLPFGYGGAIYGPVRGILHSQMSRLLNDVAIRIGDDLAHFAPPEPAEGGPGSPPPGKAPR